MGGLMKRIEKAAKSPKAKRLEKEMMDKAKDPQTRIRELQSVIIFLGR